MSWEGNTTYGGQKYTYCKKISPSGNWTRVTRVTGRYTNHYTNEDRYDRTPCHLTRIICTPPDYILYTHSNALPTHTSISSLPFYCCAHHASWPIHIIQSRAIIIIRVIVIQIKAHTMHLSLYQGLSCWQYLCGINYVYCRCDTTTAHTWQYHGVCGLTRWPCQVIVPTQHHGNTANDSDIHGAGWSLWLMKQYISGWQTSSGPIIIYFSPSTYQH